MSTILDSRWHSFRPFREPLDERGSKTSFGNWLMSADNEHILIVGTVVDRDTAPRGRMQVSAPRVGALLRSRLLETDHLRTLRIHSVD
jgi:hypothetical protein